MPKHKLTDDLTTKTLTLLSEGLSNADVCRWLGVAESTFYTWIKDPKTPAQRKLSEGMKKAEMERKAKCLDVIHKAANEGSWQAAAWYLERRYPKEYAKPKRPNEDGSQELIDTMREFIEEQQKRVGA